MNSSSHRRASKMATLKCAIDPLAFTSRTKPAAISLSLIFTTGAPRNEVVGARQRSSRREATPMLPWRGAPVVSVEFNALTFEPNRGMLEFVARIARNPSGPVHSGTVIDLATLRRFAGDGFSTARRSRFPGGAVFGNLRALHVPGGDLYARQNNRLKTSFLRLPLADNFLLGVVEPGDGAVAGRRPYIGSSRRHGRHVRE